MKEMQLFKIIDGIKDDNNIPQSIFEDVDLSLNLNTKTNKEMVKIKVINKINKGKNKKRKSFSFSKKLALFACLLSVLATSCIFIFPAQAMQLLRPFSFIPGMGFILKDVNDSYFILQKPVKLSNGDAYITLKSAYLNNKSLVVRIEGTTDFFNNLKSVSANIQDSAKVNSTVTLVDKNNNLTTPEGYSFKDIGDNKVLFEYRFRDVSEVDKNRNDYKLLFLQTNNVISFQMVSSNLLPQNNVYNGTVTSNGIEILILAIKYDDIIEADLFTQCDNKKVLSLTNSKNMILRDANGNIYNPEEKWIEADQFFKDLNKKENSQLFNPSYHYSFKPNKTLSYPISFEISDLVYNDFSDSKVWVKIDVPNIGESKTCNINSMIMGIPFTINSVKRISNENIELDISSQSYDGKKITFFNAYTYVKYDEKEQLNRMSEISEYSPDGGIKKVIIEVDPNKNVADILVSNPEISIHGPWAFAVKTF
jgi:hypothetical protein